MNRRKTIVLGGVALLLLSGAMVFWRVNDSPHLDTSELTAITQARLTSSNQIPGSVQPRGSLKTVNQAPDVESFGEYLTKSERDDNSLAAVFFLTRDGEILSELRNQAHTPVAFLTLAIHSEDPKERLAWAELWAKHEPENNAAKLLVASMLSQTNNFLEAQTALSNVLTKGRYNTPESDIKLHMVEALEDGGWTSGAACRLCDHSVYELDMAKSFQILAKNLWEQNQGTTPDERIQATTDQIRISEAVETWGRKSNLESLAWGIQIKALRQLPSDTLFGDTGYTVDETLQRLISQSTELVPKLAAYGDVYGRANDEQFARFFYRSQTSNLMESLALLEREVNRGSTP